MLPLLAIALSRASREETIANSLIASTPFRAISARSRRTSNQGIGVKWSLMDVQAECKPDVAVHKRLIVHWAEQAWPGTGLFGLSSRAGVQSHAHSPQHHARSPSAAHSPRSQAASSAPPPMVPPGSVHPARDDAPYLYGDVIGGHRARAAKIHAAKIRPLGAGAASAYMASLDRELRRRPLASASTCSTSAAAS